MTQDTSTAEQNIAQLGKLQDAQDTRCQDTRDAQDTGGRLLKMDGKEMAVSWRCHPLIVGNSLADPSLLAHGTIMLVRNSDISITMWDLSSQRTS